MLWKIWWTSLYRHANPIIYVILHYTHGPVIRPQLYRNTVDAEYIATTSSLYAGRPYVATVVSTLLWTAHVTALSL